MEVKRQSSIILFLILFLSSAAAYSIGVNYGTVSDSLPPPSKVAKFLKTQTTIDKVKLFDAKPEILNAFSGTGISVTVTAITAEIPSLAKLPNAQAWIAVNVLPYLPATKITTIAVGNEVLATSDKALIAHLVPAMESLYTALNLANVTGVHVTSPNSLGILAANFGPPSSGRFRDGYDGVVFKPMLDFHRRTSSPFTVNPYPFFGVSAESVDYALFRPNPGVFDSATGVNYTNMFDAQMDSVFAAMKRLGYADVWLVIGETGWPSAGDPGQVGVGVENAAGYNGNLVKHVGSGRGTPLMPNRTFDTYIFSLFNENMKPSVSERSYGLFEPDFTPVYDIGIMRDTRHNQAESPAPALAPGHPALDLAPTHSVAPDTGPGPTGAEDDKKKWCVARKEASDDALQKNIDYVCGSTKVDCSPINPNGSCFYPNTVASHASYAMNAFFLSFPPNDLNCDFNHTGLITHVDPSNNNCTFAGEEARNLAQAPQPVGGGEAVFRMWSLVYVFLGLACYVI